MIRFRRLLSPAAALLLGAIGLAFAFPFLWMFCAGFKSDAAIFSTFPLLPEHLDFQYYRSLLSGQWIPYPRQFWNSLFIASVETVMATVFACGAGYVFAKFHFRYKRSLFAFAILAVLVPRQVLLLPLFTWMNTLSLLDTPWAVILPGAVSGIGVLYFTAVFRRLPDALLDMARCEGAGEYRAFWMALPLVRSSWIAFALIEFVLCWQDHLLPLIMLTSNQKLTVTIALASLEAGSIRVHYGLLMAGCTLTLVPTALFFALAYRHFRTALGNLTEI